MYCIPCSCNILLACILDSTGLLPCTIGVLLDKGVTLFVTVMSEELCGATVLILIVEAFLRVLLDTSGAFGITIGVLRWSHVHLVDITGVLVVTVISALDDTNDAQVPI